MKLARLPTARGGEWWVLLHDLAVEGHPASHIRPINILTFLAQHLTEASKGTTGRYAMALEDKLQGVRIFHRELRGAVAQIGRVGLPASHLRDYEDEQRAICMLEGLLNSIYASLEVTAKLNSCIHRQSKWSFRKLAREHPVLSSSRWPWLARFLDIRSQIAHYGSPVLVFTEGKLAIEFTTDGLIAFGKGLQEIDLNEIGGFAGGLFDMLDSWAVAELEKADRSVLCDIVREPVPGRPLKCEKRLVGEILDKPAGTVDDGLVDRVCSYIESLNDFAIVEPEPGYEHMGALLADTVLQAGVKFTSVVVPRVRAIQDRPGLATTSGFLAALNAETAEAVLNFKGRKPKTALALTELLLKEAVDTPDQLKSWLTVRGNLGKLNGIHGIGDKTIDYLQNLAGLQTVSIDIHLDKFLKEAGTRPRNYDHARGILLSVARKRGVKPATLDHSIWLYMSRKKKAPDDSTEGGKS